MRLERYKRQDINYQIPTRNVLLELDSHVVGKVRRHTGVDSLYVSGLFWTHLSLEFKHKNLDSQSNLSPLHRTYEVGGTLPHPHTPTHLLTLSGVAVVSFPVHPCRTPAARQHPHAAAAPPRRETLQSPPRPSSRQAARPAHRGDRPGVRFVQRHPHANATATAPQPQHLTHYLTPPV